MAEQEPRTLSVTPLPDCDPEIGRQLARMEEARRRTRRALLGITQEQIDWQPPVANSIATLLYHIAAIEMDWLFNEVKEGHMAQTVWDNFPYPVRNVSGQLTPVRGLTLAQHDERLDSTRALLLDAFHAMSVDEYRRIRRFTDYDVTPEWVLHHLMQHEAEHRGEILTIRALAEQATPSAAS
jgi:uncharacterized damage-inducible protein DinB